MNTPSSCDDGPSPQSLMAAEAAAAGFDAAGGWALPAAWPPGAPALSCLPTPEELEGCVFTIFPETLHFAQPPYAYCAIFPTLLAPPVPPSPPSPSAASEVPEGCVSPRRARRARGGRRHRRAPEAAEGEAGPLELSALATPAGAALACRAIRDSIAERRRYAAALRGRALALAAEPAGRSVLCSLLLTLPPEQLTPFLDRELLEGLPEALRSDGSEVLAAALLERERAWPPSFEVRCANALLLHTAGWPTRREGRDVLRTCVLLPAARPLSACAALVCCGHVDVLAASADGRALLEAALGAGHVCCARSVVASPGVVRALAGNGPGDRLLAQAVGLGKDLAAELLRQVQRLPAEQQLRLTAPVREALCWKPPEPCGRPGRRARGQR